MHLKLYFAVPTKSVFNSTSSVIQYDDLCKYNPNKISISYEKCLTNAHIFKPGDERKKDFSNENLYILERNLGVNSPFTTSQMVASISAAPATI